MNIPRTIAATFTFLCLLAGCQVSTTQPHIVSATPRGSVQPAPAQAAAPRLAKEIAGRVVAIADGDTLTVLDSANTQHRIRLQGIDAPDSR